MAASAQTTDEQVDREGWRHTAFRFTLDLRTDAECEVVARHFGAARFAWNQSLALLRDALERRDESDEPENTQVPWTGFSLINAFTTWKNSEEAGEGGLSWRREVYQGVFEEACVNLGHALKAFNDSRSGKRPGPKVGFPRFKKRGKCRASCRFRARGATRILVGDIDRPRAIKLPGVIGWVRVRENTRRVRRLISRGARVLSATLVEEDGRVRVSLILECPPLHEAHRHRAAQSQDPVGLDVGLEALLVGATGDGVEVARVAPPRHLFKALGRLARANQAYARTQKGSKNRARAQQRLTRIHSTVRHRRADTLHKLTTELAKTHGHYVVETLSIRGLMRSKRTSARNIADASWGELVRQLDYKLAWRDGIVQHAPRFLPSTRACSRCGLVGPKLPPSIREFTCEGCGHSADRDADAAALLARWGEGSLVIRYPDGRMMQGGRPEVPGDPKPRDPRDKTGKKDRPVSSGRARSSRSNRSKSTAEKAAVTTTSLPG